MTIKKFILPGAALLLSGSLWMANSAPPQTPVKTTQARSLVKEPRKTAARASVVTQPFSLPMFVVPEDDEFARFIPLDANGDGTSWYCSYGYMKYDYNMNNAADDWLFIPFTLTTGESIMTLSLEMRAYMSYDKEDFEVGFGPEATPEAMTIVMDEDGLNHTRWQTFTSEFGINDAGLYYLGIHANSSAYMSGIWMKNISLSAKPATQPSAPEIVQSSTDGMSYTATVHLPQTTILDKPLEGELGLSVAVDGEHKLDLTGSPGSEHSIALELTSGRHTVTYTAFTTVDGVRIDGVPANDTALCLEVYTLPFFMVPTADEFENFCTVADLNNDESTWEYDNGEEAMAYHYNAQNQADDWVFLPPIDFGAKGGAFDIGFDAKVASSYYPESFEICVGRSADAGSMTQMMIFNDIDNHLWDSFAGKITVNEGGKWIVGIHATSPADHHTLYVGNIRITGAADNTPSTPTVKSIDFDGLSGSVTFTLPSTTVENKPLAGEVGLIVTVDGTELSRIDGQTPGNDVTVALDLAIGRHTIAAAAFITDGEEILTGSQAIAEVVVKNPEGFVYPLPFAMQPTASEFETLTIVDANNDGDSWEYNSGAGVARCVTTGEKEADDWLFSPKFAIDDTGRIYTVSVEARAYLERFPESFDICIGREATPEAMTVIASRDDMTVYLYEPVEAQYIAAEAGAYVIGIHRRSNSNAHTLSVRNLKCEDAGMSALAPAACENLSATPDATGALSATVTFNMPAKAINGSALDASDLLTATVTSASATQTVTGAPGSEQTVTLAAPDGTSTITVSMASAANGEGASTQTTVRCGFDIPSDPVVTTAVGADNLSMTVTWTDPATGQNGGPVNRAELSHIIYIPTDETGMFWNEVATIPAGTSTYTYTVEGMPLQNISFVGVQAVGSKGSSQLGLGYEVLGAPYPLPMTDNFSAGRFIYQPVITDVPSEEYSTDWYLDRPGLIVPELSEQTDNALMCMVTAENPALHARVSLPKFSTAGSVNVKATFSVYRWSAGAKATVYGNCHDAKDVKVGEIDCTGNEGWTDVELTLPAELTGKAWVNFYVEVDFTATPQAFIMRGYGIREVFTNQLSVLVKAPQEMTVGEESTIEGVITNHAETACDIPGMPEFSFSGVDAGEFVLTTPNTTEILPGGTLSVFYTLTPTADMLGSHKLTFGYHDFADERPEDNLVELDIEITTGGKPVVTDLTGAPAAEGPGIELTWSEPQIKRLGHDEVEDYDAFACGEQIGPWLNIDGDGENLCGLGFEYPGVFEPKGFQVVNFPSLGLNTDLTAHSGDQFFLAIVPEDATKAADDWLISPEVKGGTTVSFRFNVLASEYGTESIDVMYSTTGRATSDFTLLRTFSQNMRGWNPLEVTLPDDARYFAFHYRMKDTFGVCIDDIFYTPVTDAVISGYNVYRNGEKIADIHASTSFTDRDASEGDRYHVAAVTELAGDQTEHAKSNTFVNTHSGIDATAKAAGIAGGVGEIIIIGHAGEAAAIYTPDGLTAATAESLGATERIALPAGIYVVKTAGATVKVTVR